MQTRLRPVNLFRISENKIVLESLSLVKNENSDIVIDALYGEDLLAKKTRYLQDKLIKSSKERSNENLKDLYNLYRSKIQRAADWPVFTSLDCMAGEQLRLKERFLQANLSMDKALGGDYMLRDLPDRLARFREPSFLVQNNSRIFSGEDIEEPEDVAFIRKSMQWKKQFDDVSGVFTNVLPNEISVTNLPANFKLIDFRKALKSLDLPFKLVKSDFNIFGELCSFKLSFDSEKQAKLFLKKRQLLNMPTLRTYTYEQATSNSTANRTVVFTNLPESISEKEFVTKMGSNLNITRVSCPKMYPEGKLPQTSELIEYLKTERPDELEQHNVYIMEFGTKGWRRLKYDPDSSHSALNFDAFLKDTAEAFEEEVNMHKDNGAKSFKKYFKFIQKEVNKKTYFTIEDPKEFSVEISQKDFEQDLDYLSKSVFHDEDQFLGNLRVKSNEETQQDEVGSETQNDFDNLKTKILEQLCGKEESGMVKELFLPFLNQQSSGKLEELLNDLMSEEGQQEISELQSLFESGNFDNPLLQRAETHKGFIVIQFASAHEAKKSLFYSKLELSRDLHPFLLNDMGLHHLDPDFKTKKFKEIFNSDREGEDLRKNFIEDLQSNLEKVRRRDFVKKMNNAESLDVEEIDYKIGQEHGNLEAIELNSLSPRERMGVIKRNRIRDRDTIRKDFRALFDKISFFCLNDSAEFTYNLAGFETIASKMSERGRKVDGVRSQHKEVKFNEELQMIRERRQNYLNDSSNDTEQKREGLREDIRKVQDRMTRFDYQDVREELDIVLSEYGLNDLQRQSFEEMMLLNADLRDLLDGSGEVPSKVFQKIDKARTLSTSTQALRSLTAQHFSRSYDDLKETFFREMREGVSGSGEVSKELQKFEREMQYIFFGKIVENPIVQDYIQEYFQIMKVDPLDFDHQFLHIFTMDDERFIKKGDMQIMLNELYGEKGAWEKTQEILQEKEQTMVAGERNPDQTYKNLSIEQRLKEFELRDGLAVGLLKLKDDVKVDTVEAQELVDLLNYNDLEFEYEAAKDDREQMYLIKKLRGFRFNVPKYLYFLDEKNKLAETVCKLVEVPFDEYLRVDMGLPGASAKTSEVVRDLVIENPDFIEGVEELKQEFFGPAERELIWALPQDFIDREILVYKSHMSLKGRIGKLEMGHITRPIRQKEMLSVGHSQKPVAEYDILVNN